MSTPLHRVSFVDGVRSASRCGLARPETWTTRTAETTCEQCLAVINSNRQRNNVIKEDQLGREITNELDGDRMIRKGLA